MVFVVVAMVLLLSARETVRGRSVQAWRSCGKLAPRRRARTRRRRVRFPGAAPKCSPDVTLAIMLSALSAAHRRTRNTVVLPWADSGFDDHRDDQRAAAKLLVCPCAHGLSDQLLELVCLTDALVGGS